MTLPGPPDLPNSEAALAVALALCLLPAFAWLVAYVARRGHRRRLWRAQRDLRTLRALSWVDFERLTGETFRRMGYAVTETGGGGADDGIDLIVIKDGRRFVVQCKHYRAGRVGAAVVREMVGVAVHAKAAGVYIVTCGRFTKAARDFARGKPIKLIDGPALIAMITSRNGARAPSPARLAPHAST